MCENLCVSGFLESLSFTLKSVAEYCHLRLQKLAHCIDVQIEARSVAVRVFLLCVLWFISIFLGFLQLSLDVLRVFLYGYDIQFFMLRRLKTSLVASEPSSATEYLTMYPRTAVFIRQFSKM